MTNTWRKSNYIEDQRLQKDNKVKKLQRMKKAIERSKEPIEQKQDVMIERDSALNEIRKLPKVRA